MDAEVPKEVADYSPLMNRSIWSLFAFATVFTGLRAYARLSPRYMLWWDDWFLFASWICLLVSTALLTKGVDYGIGLHFEDMILENIPIVAEYSYIAGFFAILGTAWSKTSFGITLLRISSGWTKWFVWFIIISLNIVLMANAVLLWVQCWPVKRLFDEQAEGSCWPKVYGERYQTFCAIYSGVLDIVLALLPWKIVWQATLFRREKLGVLLAMSMGVFSGIMSFLKIISLDNISDVRSTTIDLKIFGLAEVATTIIAASIPILRSLVRRIWPSTTTMKSTSLRLDDTSTSETRRSRRTGGISKHISVTQTVDSRDDRPERKHYYEV